MRSLGRFMLAMVAVALLALLTATGGLVISQAAGGGSIQATVYDDAVRFTVQNEKVAVMRASARGIARDGNIPWARGCGRAFYEYGRLY